MTSSSLPSSAPVFAVDSTTSTSTMLASTPTTSAVEDATLSSSAQLLRPTLPRPNSTLSSIFLARTKAQQREKRTLSSSPSSFPKKEKKKSSSSSQTSPTIRKHTKARRISRYGRRFFCHRSSSPTKASSTSFFVVFFTAQIPDRGSLKMIRV